MLKFPKSNPAPVWVQKAGLYLVALVLFSIAAIDWIWPWEPGRRYLAENYSSSFRYCISIADSGDGVESRGYILMPDSFLGTSLIHVESTNGEITTRSSWAQLGLILFLHVAVFTSAWLQFSIDLRSARTGLSADSGTRLATIRGQFRRTWSGRTEARRFSTDAALLGFYLVMTTFLMIFGQSLVWWVQVLFGLVLAVVLVVVGVFRRRNQETRWAGLQLSGLAFAVLSAVIGVAFGFTAFETLNTHQGLVPFFLFLFGFFGFNIMEHLGLVSTFETDETGFVPGCTEDTEE